MGIGPNRCFRFLCLGSPARARARAYEQRSRRVPVCAYIYIYTFFRPKGNGLIDTHAEIVNQT